MDENHGALTAHERGDTHAGFRGVGRVILLVAVIVIVVAVILVGNIVHTGTLLPWLKNDGRSDTAVVGAAPADPAGDAAPPLTPAERVAAEDTRLSTVAGLSRDDPALSATWNTVVLAPDGDQGTVYVLDQLVAMGAVRKDDNATFTLVRNVVVRPGVQLDIIAPGSTLRLASSSAGATSIVAWGGRLQLAGAEGAPIRITSWDEGAGAADVDETDGRAYIRVRDGALLTNYADIEQLGYWSGRTGGLAITGTGFGDAEVHLTSSRLTGLHYGVFASDTSTVEIVDTTVDQSTLTGVEVTNGGTDTRIENSTITASGADGIAVSRQSPNLSVTGTVVTDSAGWGIRVDGAALADGPTTGGYGTTPSQGFTLTESRVHGNTEGGVRVISTDTTEIRQATVDEERTAVLLEGPLSGLTVASADLSSTELRGLDISGRITDATVSDSRIAGRRIAVELTGAAVVMSGNDLSVSTGSAIELAEGARADITGSTFHGVGEDAVAIWSGARTMQAGNDESDWRFQWAWVGWMNEHPMMWLWALVLLIPAIGLPLLWRRRREHQRLRELLREALLRHGEEQVATYRALPADGGGGLDAPAAVPVFAAAADAPAPAAAATEAPPASWGAASRDATRPVTPRPGPSRAPATSRPRSFADLRTGALEGRTFPSLREFAVAAVVEGGYSVSTISRLFRIQQWRLQQWVDDAVLADAAPSKERR
ncbi:MAG: right-handed parallel beta-helix repeat-containing protein [Microbacterium enclense]